MAEEKKRDYTKEWEREKKYRLEREMMVGAKLSRKLAEDFKMKCDQNGTTKNAVLKRYIERYTYENFDQ